MLKKEFIKEGKLLQCMPQPYILKIYWKSVFIYILMLRAMKTGS